MSTENTVTKEQLISKIQQIVSTEKFKMDAYFFCGSPSGDPNQELLSACEKYLETAKNSKADKDVTEKLIAELEKAVAGKLEALDGVKLPKNLADIKEVIDNKACLFE